MLELMDYIAQSGIDNSGRRLGVNRREFLYAIHIPERRSGNERRSEMDRRSDASFKFSIDMERRAEIGRAHV